MMKDEDRPFPCPTCDKRFLTASHLRDHVLLHAGVKAHKCPSCPRRFYRRADLRRHSRRGCEKPFPCKECGKKYKTEEALKIHQKYHPSGDKPFKCVDCEKSFPNQAQLTAHSRKHTGARPFKCGECSAAFAQAVSLRRHAVTHSKQGKPFECDICKKRFASQEYLKSHSLLHQKPKFNCSSCSKAFRLLRHLKQHKAIHSDTKPHQCTVCARRFFTKVTLARHSKSHSSDKPFSCDQCGAMFHRRDHLNVHLKTHEAQRSRLFECDVCQKRFATLTQLEGHQKRKHAERNRKQTSRRKGQRAARVSKLGTLTSEDTKQVQGKSDASLQKRLKTNQEESNQQQNVCQIKLTRPSAMSEYDKIKASPSKKKSQLEVGGGETATEVLTSKSRDSQMSPSSLPDRGQLSADNTQALISSKGTDACSSVPVDEIRRSPELPLCKSKVSSPISASSTCLTKSFATSQSEDIIAPVNLSLTSSNQVTTASVKNYITSDKLKKSPTDIDKYSGISSAEQAEIEVKTPSETETDSLIKEAATEVEEPQSAGAPASPYLSEKNASEALSTKPYTEPKVLSEPLTEVATDLSMKKVPKIPKLRIESEVTGTSPRSRPFGSNNIFFESQSTGIILHSETRRPLQRRDRKVEEVRVCIEDVINEDSCEAGNTPINENIAASEDINHDTVHKIWIPEIVVKEECLLDEPSNDIENVPQAPNLPNNHVQIHDHDYSQQRPGQSGAAGRSDDPLTNTQARCDICQESFRTEKLLKAHMLRSHRTSRKMKDSNKKYKKHAIKDKDSLLSKSTKKTKRRRAKEHRCDICNKSFKSAVNKEAHMVVHTGIRTHICDVCSKAFTQKSALTRHYKIHSDDTRPHQCDICNKKFTRRIYMLTHKAQHNRSDLTFKCNFCSDSFRYPAQLARHKSSSHANDAIPIPLSGDNGPPSIGNAAVENPSGEKVDRERPYKCEICGKGFLLFQHMTNHQRVHTGHQPYECDTCRKRFGQLAALHRHVKTHTVEKPYQCDVCEKRFSLSEYLTAHRVKHDKQELECPQCVLKFGLKSDLMKHRITHKRIVIYK